MGLFNSLKKIYNKITKKDNSEYQLAVNLELQKRVYQAEGKLEKAAQIEQSTLIDKYKDNWNYSKPVRSIYDREFKLVVAEYVKESYGNKIKENRVEILKAIYSSLMDSFIDFYSDKKSSEILKLEEKLKRKTIEEKEKKCFGKTFGAYVYNLYDDAPTEAKEKIIYKLEKDNRKIVEEVYHPNTEILEAKIDINRNKDPSSFEERQKRRAAYRELRNSGYLARAA